MIKNNELKSEIENLFISPLKQIIDKRENNAC